MRLMASRLPPLNALVVFEAAARHLSFTRAADSLHVTQAAVSHQIKALEEWLGVPLFHRVGRGKGLALTEAGRNYLPRDQRCARGDPRRDERGHGQAPAARAQRRDARFVRLAVAACRGCGRFLARHPGIDVRMIAADLDDDALAMGEVDIDLRYGEGDWPGFEVVRFMTEDDLPGLQPRHRHQRSGRSGRPADLDHHTLLHDVLMVDWRTWVEAAGYTSVNVDRGPGFNHSHLVVCGGDPGRRRRARPQRARDGRASASGQLRQAVRVRAAVLGLRTTRSVRMVPPKTPSSSRSATGCSRKARPRRPRRMPSRAHGGLRRVAHRARAGTPAADNRAFIIAPIRIGHGAVSTALVACAAAGRRIRLANDPMKIGELPRGGTRELMRTLSIQRERYSMALMSGADAILQQMLRNDVETIFGLPGGQLDHFFDSMYRSAERVRFVGSRHEQGAAYMAFGYARSTGRPGVYTVVPGPGVLNTAAALCTAYATNAPVLCLTGQIPSDGHRPRHRLPARAARSAGDDAQHHALGRHASCDRRRRPRSSTRRSRA